MRGGGGTDRHEGLLRRVVRVLDRLLGARERPAQLVLDNGPELIAVALAEWAESHGVKLEFIEPGKPVQNAYVESFNGRFRS